MAPAFQILLGFVLYSYLWQDTEALCCLDGWTLIGEYCYRYYDEEKSWSQAEFTCLQFRRAHLASIHSQDEMQRVANFIHCKYETGGHIWIGLHSLSSLDSRNKRWQWSDKSPEDYFAWNKEGPESHKFPDEECAKLSTYDLLSWNGSHCKSENTFICKMPRS